MMISSCYFLVFHLNLLSRSACLSRLICLVTMSMRRTNLHSPKNADVYANLTSEIYVNEVQTENVTRFIELCVIEILSNDIKLKPMG